MGLLLRNSHYYYKKQVDGRVYYRSLKLRKGQEALLSARVQQVENQIIAKHFNIPMPGICTISFKDYILKYVKQKSYKKSLDRDRARLNTIAQLWNDIPLDQINKENIISLENFLVGFSKKPTTLNRYFEVLHNLFNLAIEDGYISDNPCKYYKKYIEDYTRRCLSDSEVFSILNTARLIQDKPNSYIESIIYDLILFIFHTGLRLSEVLNLKTEYIDLNNKYITIPITETKYTRRSNNSNKKYRLIYLNKNSLNIIYKYINKKPINSCGISTSNKKNTITYNRIFFLNKDAVGPNIVYHVVQKIRKRTGILDFCFHQIRHTVSTWLSSAVSLTTAKIILGHSDIKTTMRYVHPDSKEARLGVDQIAQKMDGIAAQIPL